MPNLYFPADLFPAGHGPVFVDKTISFIYELSTTIGIDSTTAVYNFIVTGLSDLSAQDGLDPALLDSVAALVDVTVSSEATDVGLTSTVLATFYEIMSTTISATTSSTNNMNVLIQLATALSASDVVDDIWQGVLAVVTTLTTLTYLNRAFETDLTDTLGITISVDEIWQAYVDLTTTLSATATSERNLSVLFSLSTALSASASTDPYARFLEALQTDVGLAGVIQIADATYFAVTMNIANRGVTEYSNFPFTSYTKFNNQYLGAASDGIYLLEGSDDAGTNILASIKTGLWDFDIVQHKVIPEAYFGYTSDGDLILKLIYVEQGSKKEQWYELTRTKDTEDTDRFQLPRGVKSRYFQFELADQSGADWRVDDIKLYPVVLTRRIY